MTRSKLSDIDRQEILTLYRESAETTSTLAERYGVSGTTIRRVLKDSLSQQEDQTFTHQKHAPRLTKLDQRTSHSAELGPSEVKLPESPLPLQKVLLEEEIASVPPKDPPAVIGEPTSLTPYLQSQKDSDQPSPQLAPVEPRNTELPSTKPLRRRSTTSVTVANQSTINQAKPRDTAMAADNAEIPGARAEFPTSSDFDPVNLYGSDDPEDFKELEEELDILDDEEEDFEDDLEVHPLGEKTPMEGFVYSRDLHVLPFSEAAIPKTCYLVIDRSAELITRPLKDFGELGQIPLEEVQERTLPIFDNHRVARRFSNRTQRVIKIPDGDMLQKACSHLHSKGITRMLINGQVYSL